MALALIHLHAEEIAAAGDSGATIAALQALAPSCTARPRARTFSFVCAHGFRCDHNAHAAHTYVQNHLCSKTVKLSMCPRLTRINPRFWH